MVWSDDVFAHEIQQEWRQALPGIIAGEPDRTDLMKSARRIGKGPITVGEIVSAVSAETNVTVTDITGPRQLARIVRPRRMALSLACELVPSLTHDQIAGHFNRSSHLVSQAAAKARQAIKKDPAFAHSCQCVRWRLGLP